jgi:hypothetical protein
MVTELGGSVFEITHDLVGDLFRAKNAGVTPFKREPQQISCKHHHTEAPRFTQAVVAGLGLERPRKGGVLVLFYLPPAYSASRSLLGYCILYLMKRHIPASRFLPLVH